MHNIENLKTILKMYHPFPNKPQKIIDLKHKLKTHRIAHVISICCSDPKMLDVFLNLYLERPKCAVYSYMIKQYIYRD